MKIKEIIKRKTVHACNPATGLASAAEKMKKTNVGALPVTDKKNHVVGIITDRDICLALADRKARRKQLKVGDIMTKEVVTVTPGEDLSYALEQMRENKVSRLPVVNKSGELKGIVSLHNLLANATSRGAGLSIFSGESREVLNTAGAVSAAGRKNDAKGNGTKRSRKDGNIVLWPTSGSIWDYI